MAKSKKDKGLNPKLYNKGLSKKRMAKGSAGNRLRIKQGETAPVMFLETPEDMQEFDQHQFRDGNNWQYVPCAGEECPLCDDEDGDRSNTRYRFCCNVYSLKERRVLILEGPKDLSSRIMFRYERSPEKFMKRVFDITMMDTQPVSYSVDRADEDPVRTTDLKKKRHDKSKYIREQMERFYGEKMPNRSSLDDDDEDSDSFTKSELMEMDKKELKSVAKEFGIKTADRTRKEIVKRILKAQEG